MWVLDMDTLTLWLRGQRAVVERVALASPEVLAITIITVEEIISGWYRLIRQARNDAALVRGYRWLQQSVEFLRDVRILSLDENALELFHELRRQHRTIGTNDLRIAAITLKHDATLVTRNRQDFSPINGLELENWAG